MKLIRIGKDDYYLSIARAVSLRSPCLKMKVGAIIVKDDSILSTGYNGPPRGDPHCETCPRIDKPTGSDYKDCPAVHAEENAIINAARNGTRIVGAVMYLYNGKDIKPCHRCDRAIKNAGIEAVIYE